MLAKDSWCKDDIWIHMNIAYKLEICTEISKQMSSSVSSMFYYWTQSYIETASREYASWTYFCIAVSTICSRCCRGFRIAAFTPSRFHEINISNINYVGWDTHLKHLGLPIGKLSMQCNFVHDPMATHTSEKSSASGHGYSTYWR